MTKFLFLDWEDWLKESTWNQIKTEGKRAVEAIKNKAEYLYSYFNKLKNRVEIGPLINEGTSVTDLKEMSELFKGNMKFLVCLKQWQWL